ncbi:MAG: DUF4173 domain-containing protein [Deltaproteobacteria bacterium]|nr:DUF4173 domain-containing protein [Deltaproteobacteria bacterium]
MENIREDAQAAPKGTRLLLLMAVVAITDQLLYNYAPKWSSKAYSIAYAGWSAGAFFIVLNAAIAAARWSELKERRSARNLLFTLNAALALSCAIEPSMLTLALSVAGAIALALLPNATGRYFDTESLANNIVKFLPRFFYKLMPDLKRSARESMRGGALKSTVFWVPAALFSITFIMLFAIANPLIESALSRGLTWAWNALVDPFRVFFWLMTAMLCWPLLATEGFRLTEPKGHIFYEEAFADKKGRTLKDKLSCPASLTRALVAFNAIFLVQTAMDCVYLLGNAALPPGFTFAEYAHRGAYILIFTALLAGAFTVLAVKPGSDSSKSALVKKLLSLWIAQNIFLVFTSALRTVLYIEAYSLTLFRVAALVWMGLVAAGLTLLVIRIYKNKSDSWLVNANGAAVLAVLVVSLFVNFRGFIASYNVAHSLEVEGTGLTLDVQYLRKLGPEAIPALTKYIDTAKLTDTKFTETVYARDYLVKELRQTTGSFGTMTVRRRALLAFVTKADTSERRAAVTK